MNLLLIDRENRQKLQITHLKYAFSKLANPCLQNPVYNPDVFISYQLLLEIRGATTLFQTMIVLSFDPLTKLPSPSTNSEYTIFECPLRVLITFPVATRHILMVQSPEQLTRSPFSSTC